MTFEIVKRYNFKGMYIQQITILKRNIQDYEEAMRWQQVYEAEKYGEDVLVEIRENRMKENSIQEPPRIVAADWKD